MASHPKIDQGRVDALKPEDPRVEHKTLDVGGGITYHYLLANPVDQEPVATVVLIHGWYVPHNLRASLTAAEPRLTSFCPGPISRMAGASRCHSYSPLACA